MRRNWIPAVCVTGFYGTSLILFLINGGFGGGHGRYDQLVFVASLPWGLLEGALPETVLVRTSDLVMFILIPFILNMALVYIVLWVICPIRSRNSI